MKMFSGIKLLAAFCVLGCTLEAVAADDPEEKGNIGRGHITVPSLSPGHLLRPSVVISKLTRSRKGEVELSSTVTWGNVWNYRENVFVYDAELVRFDTKLTWALSDGIKVGVLVPVSGRIGGAADEVIEDFHRALGLGDADRPARPRDEILIEITNAEGETFRRDEKYWGINDIPVFVTVLLTEGDACWPAAGLTFGGSVPVGDDEELFGVGEPVFGCGALASKRLNPTSAHIVTAGASFTFTPRDELAGIRLERVELAGLLGWEWQCSESVSVLGQYAVHSPVAKDFFELADPIHELNLGVKWDLSDHAQLEFSVTENLFAFNNSTDFGAHFGITVDL